MNKRIIITIIFFALTVASALCQPVDLTINDDDIRLEPAMGNNNALIGYNLYIRKKAAMESVLLTEKTGQYALRALAWNEVNGNEIRYHNGKPLTGNYSPYNIISSQNKYDAEFGRAFHLFLPLEMVYGNPSSVNGIYGKIHIAAYVNINIRTFSSRYADYTNGKYWDNFFRFVVPVTTIPPASIYEPEPQPASGSDPPAIYHPSHLPYSGLTSPIYANNEKLHEQVLKLEKIRN
jgi:hypothetical protein